MGDVKPSPCIVCPGRCCSWNLLDVCGYDAWAIVSGLNIKPMDFLAFAQLQEEEMPYNFQLDGAGRSHYLVLNIMKEHYLEERTFRCAERCNDSVEKLRRALANIE